jgi:hypothetical protein
MPGESDIETKSCKYAASLGLYARKFISHHIGVPDRIIVGSITLFLEFKDLGERPDDGQQDEIETICAVGGYSTWVDNIDDAFALILLVRDGKGELLRKMCDHQNNWKKREKK